MQLTQRLRTNTFTATPFLYKTFLTAFVCLTMNFAAGAQHKKVPATKNPTNTATATNTSLSYTIISAEANTFGYDILDNGRKMIHQPSVPGLPGNKGFKTKLEAE